MMKRFLSLLVFWCAIFVLPWAALAQSQVPAPINAPPAIAPGNIFVAGASNQQSVDSRIAATALTPAPLNVKGFGVTGGAHIGDSTCTWPSGTNVQLFCPNYTFTAADTGHSVTLNLAGPGNAPLNTTFSGPGSDSHHETMVGTVNFASTYSLPSGMDIFQANFGNGYRPGDVVCMSSFGSVCGTVKVVQLSGATINNAGAGGTNGAIFLMGTSAALAGQPFIVAATIAGGVVTSINGLTRPANYDTTPAVPGAEPVVPAIKDAYGNWVRDRSNPLTGATLGLSFAVSPLGLGINRTTTAINNLNCGGTVATGGGGTGLQVTCSQVFPTATFGHDDTAGFLAAGAAAVSSDKCVYIPADHYYSQIWNMQLFSHAYMCGDSSFNVPLQSVVFVQPNTAGDMVDIVDCNQRGLQQFGGTLKVDDVSGNGNTAGCGVIGVTFVGLRESTQRQNAVMSVGACLWCRFAFYAFSMRGRALGTEADASGNGGVAESIIDQFRFEHMGDVDYTVPGCGSNCTVHVPTIDLIGLGNTPENNVRFIVGRVFHGFSDELHYATCDTAINNASNATIDAGSHFESSGMTQSGAGGNLIHLGDVNCEHEAFPKLGGGYVLGATSGTVGGINVEANLANPMYGYSAVLLDAANNIWLKGSIGGTGGALGKGVNAPTGCVNCNPQFAQNGAGDYSITFGGGGSGNTYNAFGAEAGLTKNIEASEQPGGANPVQYPAWTVVPGFPTWSTQTAITATPGGGATNAFLLSAAISTVGTVATVGDSVMLPPEATGVCMLVINSGNNPMTVWGNTGPGDTINGAASVSEIPNSQWLFCGKRANQWEVNVPQTRQAMLQACAIQQGAAATAYYFLMGTCASASAAENTVNNTPEPTAGEYHNLYVQAGAAPTGGDTYTFTLRKNGSPTTLTCVVTSASNKCNDTTDVVIFSINDNLDMQVVSTGTSLGKMNFSMERDNP